MDLCTHAGGGRRRWGVSNKADVLSISDFRTCGSVLPEILHWLSGRLGAFEVVQEEKKNSSKFIMQSIQLPSWEGRFQKAFGVALRWGGHQCDQS